MMSSSSLEVLLIALRLTGLSDSLACDAVIFRNYCRV